MYRSISQIKEALLSGKTVLEITQSYLMLIEQNSHLNAFLEVFEKSALESAQTVDQKLKEGKAGKLAGVVIGIKDNICYKNHRVSAASKILEGFESIYTATALQRLIDEDAIIIGRLNCDEFAMGSSNENSAVAVSAGLCTVSLGSDTGGSVRQPASWTGTYGLKPTYGRISRYGLIAYASSFDQIGTFTNNLEDTRLLLSIMAGKDEFDSTSSSIPLKENVPVSEKLRIGIISECLNHPGLDKEVKSFLDQKINALKSAGHEVEELSFPFLDYLVPAYYVLTTAEASSNLARFDGVHYGYRSTNAVGVEQTYINSRSEGFGVEVKRRIMAGTFVLSHEFYDAYYTKAQKVRRILKDKTDEIFRKVDFLLIPTTPSTAFEMNAIKDNIQMYLQDIFTVHANLTGNPAMSIPLGNHSNGLPFGVQIMSDRFKEAELFEYAEILEKI